MFIELHLIQSFAPSNLNRDDTGNPKDTEFGGARRARISSQCIKRAIRLEPVFAQVTGVEPSARTRWMTRKLSKKLLEAGKSEADAQNATRLFAEAFSGTVEEGQTNVLIYLSDPEYQAIADGLQEKWGAVLHAAQNPEDKEAQEAADIKGLVKDFLKTTRGRTSAPDIALFGRMLAIEPQLNLDAACQVAHAISTHRVNMDLDFFTAVDDLQQRSEETGSAHMGVTGFNSACFYRYARLDWGQLLENLDGDTALARRSVEGFLRAALRAMPTGKQNAFAAQNPPSLALAVSRSDGMSWSLANAFERPIQPDRQGGFIVGSILAADAYWGQLTAAYGTNSMTPVTLLVEDVELDALQGATVPDAEAWIDRILDALPEE
jgi:CRISPR system Cascade subunit CasC